MTKPDDKGQSDTPERKSRLNTRRRIVLAVSGLVVVAVAMMVINQVIKTKTSEEVAIADPVQSLVIESDGGTISLSESAAGISVEKSSTYVFRKPKSGVEVNDGALSLTGDCGGVRVGTCSVSYTVAVPANVTVQVKDGFENLQVRGLKSALTVQAKGGSVALDSIYGSVNVVTASGSVEGNKLSARDVTVVTQKGAIKLTFAASPSNVQAQSESGDVDVMVPKGATTYAVNATSQTGRTELQINRDAASPFNISARSTSGNVTVEQG